MNNPSKVTVQGPEITPFVSNFHNPAKVKDLVFFILDTKPSLKLAQTRFSVPVEEPESTSQQAGLGAGHGWWAGCGNDVL